MHSHPHQPSSPWSPYWNRPPAPAPTPPGSMRVSDAERTEVTNQLIRHFADGRLDDEEYNARLAKASAAKTRDDLAPLLLDLPRLDGNLPAHSSPPPVPPRRWASVALVVLAGLVVGWMLTGLFTTAFFHPHVPWLLIAIVAFFFFRRRRWHAGWHRHYRDYV